MRAEFTSRSFSGVPTFFRASCREVRRGSGSAGYDGSGYQLMSHVESLVPHALEDDEWDEEINRLFELIQQRDDEAVLAWFDQSYPLCMAMIPWRRRGNFLSGIYKAAENW